MTLKFVLSLAVFSTAIFVYLVFGANVVFAQVDIGVDAVAQSSGLQNIPLPTLIGRIISTILGLLGIIFLIQLMYAGWLFMTSQGETDKSEKAKKIITQAIIGLVIMVSAYAITGFVVQALTGEGIFGDGSGTGAGSGGGVGVSIERFSGSLGSGALRDHYPDRNATDVARNTKILITFNQAMDISSFISGYDTSETPLDVSDDVPSTTLNDDLIKIYRTGDDVSGALSADEVSVLFTDNLRTFIFDPPLLGSSLEDVQYSVFLSNDLRNASGDTVLDSGGYLWSFTVGTILDLDPPVVERVSPSAGGVYGRNITVQITFNEPIDPTSASGEYNASTGANFENIKVQNAAGLVLDGIYRVSNGYKTVTFQSRDECGTNSCGDTMYCLSPDDEITVTIKAGTPGVEPPQVDVFPYDGIVDINANALDGNGDGTAGDDYAWSFETSNDINLSEPRIESISPDIEGSNVELDQNIVITFDSIIDYSTITSDNILIESNPAHEMWYKPFSRDIEGQTEVTLRHGVFLESTDDQSYSYGVTVLGDLKNEYQNCFNPADGPGAGSNSCGVSSSEPFCCNGIPRASSCALF